RLPAGYHGHGHQCGFRSRQPDAPRPGLPGAAHRGHWRGLVCQRPPPTAFIDVAGPGAGMTDRPVILITGATDGLGRALAHRTPQAYDGGARAELGTRTLQLTGQADPA